jgi:single-stranded-DNA-specific exonuclease
VQISLINQKRQKLVDELLLHAIEKSKGIKDDSVIIVSDEKYHEGVIGLIASRLTEMYYKPSIVLSTKGNKAKASARSIKGVNIIENIRSLQNLIIEGGGHEQAAGFTIENKNLKNFSAKLNKLVKPLLTDEVLTKKLVIDSELQFNQINYSLVSMLEKFSPTGYGNPAPVFCTSDTAVENLKIIGKDHNHLKLKVKKSGITIDAVAFGFGNLANELATAQKISIAYSLEENIWNGRKTIQLKIKDFKYEKN